MKMIIMFVLGTLFGSIIQIIYPMPVKTNEDIDYDEIPV